MVAPALSAVLAVLALCVAVYVLEVLAGEVERREVLSRTVSWAEIATLSSLAKTAYNITWRLMGGTDQAWNYYSAARYVLRAAQTMATLEMAHFMQRLRLAVIKS